MVPYNINNHQFAIRVARRPALKNSPPSGTVSHRMLICPPFGCCKRRNDAAGRDFSIVSNIQSGREISAILLSRRGRLKG